MSHTQFILFFIMLGSAAGLVVSALFLGFRGRSPREGEAVPGVEEMRRHTVWRLFYINASDPRGWVPKPYGYGSTVNLRVRSWMWIILLLFFTTIASAVAMALVGRR